MPTMLSFKLDKIKINFKHFIQWVQTRWVGTCLGEKPLAVDHILAFPAIKLGF